MYLLLGISFYLVYIEVVITVSSGGEKYQKGKYEQHVVGLCTCCSYFKLLFISLLGLWV